MWIDGITEVYSRVEELEDENESLKEYIKQLEEDKKGFAISYANAVARNLTLKERIEELEEAEIFREAKD